MNRIERISAILIQLQSKKIVTAKEIADRFEISLRTVYRDIRALEETGVPISAEAGIGYSIVDGYKLPPVQFTIPEATAFLTAEKLIEKLTDTGIEREYKSALFKIKSILRATEKNYLETIENNIEVLQNQFLPDSSGKVAFLQQLIDAISSAIILEMAYFAQHSEELTTRQVEPVGVFFSSGRWHLIAYCRLRNDYRNFRLDRIRSLKRTPDNFQKNHPSLKSFLQKTKQQEALIEIILEIDNKVVRYLGEQKYYNGFVSEKKGKTTTQMTFLTASVEGMARWYLMIGDSAVIISPPELKARVKVLHNELKKRIG
ncbi:MAG: YafY family transcriptional regulator [Bacteroidetes bacterium]|nr:YafY family transcriptional regulator [Bacteroidota bacterium]